jgi:UMF1 family MFS transporter
MDRMTVAGPAPAHRHLTGQEAAWSLTEAANEPFFNLVQRYVFAPYFAGTVAATQAEGASIWGFALGAAGLAIAILAPVLGSIADSGARLKPWLAGAGVVTALASASLWFAVPGSPLLAVAVAVFVAAVAVELMNQFSNAFLPVAVRRERMGLLSGLSFGISQLAGLLVLLLVLVLSQAMPAWLAAVPHGIDRLAGPIAAAAVAIFLTPFLFVARDRVPTARASATAGLAALRLTLAEAWADRNMRLFLLARMLAADGMTIVFAFGAVLAAASFGWKADTLARFGLVITVFGVLGGFAAGFVDRLLGPRRLSLLGLVLIMIGSASVVLTDQTRLFGIETGIALAEPLASPQEWGFMLAGAFIAAGAAFALAGMRTMMALLAPAPKIAAYFGLYAFVGKATAFVGPTLVGAVAAATGSVRPGIAVAVLFLAAGAAALAAVRSPNARLA